MAVHYAWVLLVLPWAVSIGASLLGGFLVGIIVTVTHQSETIISPLTEHNYCFVTDQYLSTRDVKTADPLMEFLWGGMQYQVRCMLCSMSSCSLFVLLLKLLLKLLLNVLFVSRSVRSWSIISSPRCRVTSIVRCVRGCRPSPRPRVLSIACPASGKSGA